MCFQWLKEKNVVISCCRMNVNTVIPQACSTPQKEYSYKLGVIWWIICMVGHSCDVTSETIIHCINTQYSQFFTFEFWRMWKQCTMVVIYIRKPGMIWILFTYEHDISCQSVVMQPSQLLILNNHNSYPILHSALWLLKCYLIQFYNKDTQWYTTRQSHVHSVPLTLRSTANLLSICLCHILQPLLKRAHNTTM